MVTHACVLTTPFMIGNHLMDAVSGKAWALPYWEVPLRQKKKSPILATNLDMRVQIRS
jgi:hypothetical protein